MSYNNNSVPSLIFKILIFIRYEINLNCYEIKTVHLKGFCFFWKIEKKWGKLFLIKKLEKKNFLKYKLETKNT